MTQQNRPKPMLLAALLFVQLVVVTWFWWDSSVDENRGTAKLLELVPADVAELHIDSPTESIVIQRSDAGWQADELPADAIKVNALLEKLAALPAAWPVAQSEATAQRFEVADNRYQRKVQLLNSQDEMIASFYLGTSPGFQKVHARNADVKDIYSVSLSNFELPTDLTSWFDKTLLALSATPDKVVVTGALLSLGDAILAPQGEPLTLSNEVSGWTANGQTANALTLENYLTQLRNLRVIDFAEASAAEPIATIELFYGGASQVLSLYQDEVANAYQVTAATGPAQGRWFRMAKNQGDLLRLQDQTILPVTETARSEED